MSQPKMQHYIRTHPDNLHLLQAGFGTLTQISPTEYTGKSAYSGTLTDLFITLDENYDVMQGGGLFEHRFLYETNGDAIG